MRDSTILLMLMVSRIRGSCSVTGSLAEKAVEVVKDEAPHIAHKAGEIIEEIAKKVK